MALSRCKFALAEVADHKYALEDDCLSQNTNAHELSTKSRRLLGDQYAGDAFFKACTAVETSGDDISGFEQPFNVTTLSDQVSP